MPPLCVMLVDDDPGITKLHSIILRRKGYEVLSAPDGQTALEMLDDATPDVFVLDILMPGMDGFELCQKLRARPQTVQKPVIFISAMADVEARDIAFRVGANAFLVKPFTPKDLTDRIEFLVAAPAAPAIQADAAQRPPLSSV